VRPEETKPKKPGTLLSSPGNNGKMALLKPIAICDLWDSFGFTVDCVSPFTLLFNSLIESSYSRPI
jgi:hypothetical protein